AEDAKIAARVRALVLDPRLDITSVGNILFSQIRNPLTRAATWSWLAANRDAILGRVPEDFRFFYADLGASFCSPAGRHEFDALLAPALGSGRGGVLEVARVEEIIDDCIALKERVAPGLASALATTP
ncbi:MAG: hypothetical protein JO361_00730, partial [Gammaproteobacteria bacterium]|nr:hypothetical protein [Gammaproteobacteria bacterium]